MASILIISKIGESIDIALRLADEGHIVKMFVEEGTKSLLLAGRHNPTRVSDPHKMIEQYDLVICDSVGLGAICDTLKEKDKLVVGGSTFCDKLVEEDYTHKILYNVLKVEKLTNEVEEVGISIVSEGWFNKTWLKPFNHTIKMKRLMDGGKGPNMGCMGITLWLTSGDKVIETMFEPLTPLLEKVNFVGPFTIRSFVTKEQIYFNGFIPTFNHIQPFCELLKQSLFDFLYGMAIGSVGEINCYYDYSLSVNLLIATQSVNGVVSVPVEAKKHVWLTDVNKVVATVTARGQTVRECQRRAYRTIGNIVKSKEVMYRSDIGNNVEERVAELREWGWLN